MHAIKVQYNIHDVVPVEAVKRNRTRKTDNNLSRPGTAQSSSTKSAKAKTETKNAPPPPLSLSSPRSTGLAANFDQRPPPPAAGPLPRIPAVMNSPRRLARPTTAGNKPDWNISLSVPDRDLLIMEQDLMVDKYRSQHHKYDQGVRRIPQPKLTDLERRKSLKEISSEDKRNRVDHNSFGAAVNDPLPAYPFLKHQTGIHGSRWVNDSKLPVEHDDWAKPLPKRDKTHEAFEKEFRPKKPPLPSQEIDVQHSIASVVSSYTLAGKQRSFKSASEKRT